MNRIKITLKYEGTAYAGFQAQPHATTVQGELNKALKKTHGDEQHTVASGRTDAGVHAEGQVVHYDLRGQRMPLEKLVHIINRHLPADIRVLDACGVEKNFHARYSARVRHYRYRLMRQRAGSISRHVADERFSHAPSYEISVQELACYLRPLIGIHDYTSYASVHDGSKTKQREIFSIQVTEKGHHIDCDFWSNGFLKNQIRSMIGTALFAFQKKKDFSYLSRVLEAKNAALAKARAPAKGLTLAGVYYTPIFGWRDYYKPYGDR